MRANLTEHVVSTILNVIPHSYDTLQTARDSSAVPRSVKRAEDYMHANAGAPITLQILAREAGCSERALQNAFKSFRDKTPMAALRDIRLENARRDLELDCVTVTEIAFKWGFANLGRFAAQYAAKFGETPSQTRRKG